jgi:PAS domain S-box-containing protein
MSMEVDLDRGEMRPLQMEPEPGIDAIEIGIPANAEAHLEALIQSSDDPIWSVDLDFGIVTVNLASQRFLESGLGFKAQIGARPEDLVSPAEAAIWTGFYRRALAEGSLRVEHVLPSGRTMEMTFNRIVASGRVVGISGLGKDITGRKQAERALQEADRKYRDIFDGRWRESSRLTLTEES